MWWDTHTQVVHGHRPEAPTSSPQTLTEIDLTGETDEKDGKDIGVGDGDVGSGDENLNRKEGDTNTPIDLASDSDDDDTLTSTSHKHPSPLRGFSLITVQQLTCSAIQTY